jgi:EmrB/QacA subfamily drug resistance transporter
MAETRLNGEASGNTPANTPPALTASQRWTLAVVCVATFMLMLDVTAVAIALKGIAVSLTADFSDVQWVIDAYTLTLAAFLLTSGSMADRLGRRAVFNVGLVVFTLSSAVLGASPNILTLIIFRALQGVGAAVLFAVGPALIGNEFRGRERGMAFGMLGGVAGLSIAIGPLIGGFLTSGESWRWIFLLNVPVGVAALIISLRQLRESREPQAHPIDWVGTFTFAVGLGLLVFAFLRSGPEGWTGYIPYCLVAGVVLLVVFTLVELRLGARAMFDLSLFRIPSFSGITIATLLSNAAVVSAIVLQLLFMQNALGHTAWETGIRFIPQTFTVFFVAMITGAVLTQKLPPGVLIGAAIAFIAAGIGLAAIVEPSSTWTALLPSLFATGIGMGLFNPPRAAVTIGVVEPARAGMANGMGESFQQVGVAVGIAAFGALFHQRVVAAFVSSEAGQQLGAQAGELGHVLLIHGQKGVIEAVPPELATRVSAAAQAAFVTGFNQVMIICGLVAGVGAVLAFLLIRQKDLHESALGPGQAPGAAGEAGAQPHVAVQDAATGGRNG